MSLPERFMGREITNTDKISAPYLINYAVSHAFEILFTTFEYKNK